MDREIERTKASLACAQARHAYIAEQNLQKARDYYEKALRLFRGLNDATMVAETLCMLSEVRRELGQDLAAIRNLEEALDIYHVAQKEM